MKKFTADNSERNFPKLSAGTLCIGIALLFTTSKASELRLDGYTQLGLGYGSNILRQPSVMDTGKGLFNPVKGEKELSGEGLLKISSGTQLRMTLHGAATLYPNNSAADEYQGDGRMEYRHPLSQTLNIKFSGNSGYYRRLAIDESGDGEPNLYHYWKNGVGFRIAHQTTRMINIQAECGLTYENHREQPLLPSIDNHQSEISLAMNTKIDSKEHHQLILNGSLGYKSYSTLKAYTSQGKQYDANPLRQFQYLAFIAGYQGEFPIATVELQYEPRKRTDIFQDFYTYFENGIASKVNFRLPKDTRLGIEGEWRKRSYLVHEAFRPGPNPKLVMICLLYTSPSPRDRTRSRMPSSA